MEPRGPSGSPAGRGARGCLFALPALIAVAVIAYVLRDGIPPAADGGPPVELVLAVALLFASVLVGAVLFFRRRRRDRSDEGNGTGAAEPLTGSAKSRRKGLHVARLAFGVFLLAGIGFMIPFGLMFWRLLDSQTWEETRCTVLSSSVGTHSDSDGSTYSIDISYRYVWDGTLYTGNRYNFTFGSSSGYEGKAEVVARYPPGTQVVCWVDSGDPERSVLVRSVGWEALFILLPLVFVLVGGAGLLGSFGAFGNLGSPRRDDWLPGTTAEESADEASALAGRVTSALDGRVPPDASEPGVDPNVLEPQVGPKGRLVGSVVGAILWNGLVGTALYFVVFRGDGVDGCAAVFLGLFALVGLFLLASVPYYALALANPRPVLRLGGVLAPGRTVRVSWRFEGKAERIRRLVFKLEGREEARYRRGTNTYTAKNVFHEAVLLDVPDRGGIPSGETTLALPAGTMHSFDGGNNKIVWTLSVEGDIPRWPDVKEEFVLTVRPEGLAR